MELWHFAFLQSIELYSDRAAELVTELIFLSRTAQLSECICKRSNIQVKFFCIIGAVQSCGAATNPLLGNGNSLRPISAVSKILIKLVSGVTDHDSCLLYCVTCPHLKLCLTKLDSSCNFGQHQRLHKHQSQSKQTSLEFVCKTLT